MRVKRSFSSAISATALIPAMAFAVSGCGSKGGTGTSSPAACAATADQNRAAATGPKIQLSKTQTKNVSHDSTRLAAGTEITVVLRDACQTPGPIATQIPDRQPGVTKAGVRSYPWQLPTPMTVGDLHHLAESDACVVMIADSQSDELIGESDASNQSQAMPDDPDIGYEQHLTAMGASAAYDVFFNPTTGIKKDVVIAIIDSGVRIDHEDLRESLWVNRGEIPANGIDDDQNGYIDDVNGYNFASGIGSPQPQRTSANAAWQWAHGTKVAGLAAATSNNGRGGAGVDGKAKIMALNNMGPYAGMSQASTANAIRYAVDNGADVINLSLGGSNGISADYQNALRYAISKGVVVLAAAGNESMLIGSSYSAAGQGASMAGLISVGNYQSQNYYKSSTSNYSTTYVELGAPGTNTMSSLLYTTSPETTTSYSYFSGTSAAVPVASGAAALAIGLIKSRGYSYKAADIEWLLETSAKKMPQLASYFKDGNALDLANLAKLVDSRYPARGSRGSGGGAKRALGAAPDDGSAGSGPGSGSGSGSGSPDCPTHG